MNIIPAIDIIEGRCVRLLQGEFDREVSYPSSPVEMARAFEAMGLRRLHLVDLDGARSGKPQNLAVLEEITRVCHLAVDFSGGLRTADDVQAAFDRGASFVAVGSAAVRQPEEVERWIGLHGAEKLIIGADVRGDEISVSGWAEQSGVKIDKFVQQWAPKGITTFLCTSIEKDGLLEGPNFRLYEQLDRTFPELTFIVSGGVSSLDDLRTLEASGAKAVIVGRAFSEGRIKAQDLQEFLC